MFLMKDLWALQKVWDNTHLLSPSLTYMPISDFFFEKSAIFITEPLFKFSAMNPVGNL